MIIGIRESKFICEGLNPVSSDDILVIKEMDNVESYQPIGGTFYVPRTIQKIITVERRGTFILERHFVGPKQGKLEDRNIYQVLVRILPTKINKNYQFDEDNYVVAVLDKKGIENTFAKFNDTNVELEFVNNIKLASLESAFSWGDPILEAWMYCWKNDAKKNIYTHLSNADALNWNLKKYLNYPDENSKIFNTNNVASNIEDMLNTLNSEKLSINYIRGHIEENYIPNAHKLFPHQLSESLLINGAVSLKELLKFTGKMEPSIQWDLCLPDMERDIHSENFCYVDTLNSDWMKLCNILYYFRYTDLALEYILPNMSIKLLGNRYNIEYDHSHITQISRYLINTIIEMFPAHPKFRLYKDFDNNLIISLFNKLGNETPDVVYGLDLTVAAIINHGLVFGK